LLYADFIASAIGVIMTLVKARHFLLQRFQSDLYLFERLIQLLRYR
jgi:hypothetical protein